MDIKKQLIDQAAHFVLAASVVAVASMLGAELTILSSGFIGLSLGVTREITEDGSIFTKGSILDMIFWTLGGVFQGIILALH